MLNQFKPKPKIEEGQPNIKIKATNTRGSGYADITFSKFATHMYVAILLGLITYNSSYENIRG